MKLTLANTKHAPAISDFYRSIHDDSFPHPELFSETSIERLMREGELAVIIASHYNEILGCGIGFPSLWNQSFEIGSLSIGSVEQYGEIGRALFEGLRRFGSKQYGITYFRTTTESGFRRAKNVGASAWGYRILPGARNANDAELLMGFYNNHNTSSRVHPPDNIITRLPFAARIVDGLVGETGVTPYPKNYPVGVPKGTGAPLERGRIWPTYHSEDNFVTIESSTGPDPSEIIRTFVTKVRKKGVADVRLFLPVNHVQPFANLLELGFIATAYLPGWYLRGNQRFDCIEMVAGAPRIPRNAETFTERATHRILRDLTPTL